MNIQTLPATAGERTVAHLIERAGEVLRSERSGVPDGFVARLFERASAEDIAVYKPDEIAAFAAQAFAFLSQRQPGVPKIRIYAPEAAPDGEASRSVSVLEIINDDMPFIVDSVMAELTARHVHVRLVVHPIFAVARDATGRLEQVSTGRAGDRGRASRKLHPGPSRPHHGCGNAEYADHGARAGARRCQHRGA